MVLSLRYKVTTSVPVEVEGITPGAVRELSLADIERLEGLSRKCKSFAGGLLRSFRRSDRRRHGVGKVISGECTGSVRR